MHRPWDQREGVGGGVQQGEGGRGNKASPLDALFNMISNNDALTAKSGKHAGQLKKDKPFEHSLTCDIRARFSPIKGGSYSFHLFQKCKSCSYLSSYLNSCRSISKGRCCFLRKTGLALKPLVIRHPTVVICRTGCKFKGNAPQVF